LLAARGIIVSHETVRQWARKFGQQFANQIRRRLPRVGDKWHLDEVVLKIAGMKHWLWRAVDQTDIVLDVLVQRRRDKQLPGQDEAGRPGDWRLQEYNKS
jgi:putative transposase